MCPRNWGNFICALPPEAGAQCNSPACLGSVRGPGGNPRPYRDPERASVIYSYKCLWYSPREKIDDRRGERVAPVRRVTPESDCPADDLTSVVMDNAACCHADASPPGSDRIHEILMIKTRLDPQAGEAVASELSAQRRRALDFEQIQHSMGRELIAFFSVPQRRVPGLEPDDLAQMTLFRVYLSMESFRHRATIRTWVLRIAVNVWKNALRDREAAKRCASKEVSLDSRQGTEDKFLDPRENPLQDLLAEERTTLLLSAIDSLPKKTSRCMVLRFKDQLSIQEIACLLRVESTTVKSHLREGKRRLGPLLRERFGILEGPES